MSTPFSTPSGHTETPSNASNFMMQLLTSIGTLYAAMGRPPFTAQEPVSGVIETLEEASRRLSANTSLQDLENRVLLLEQEKRAMLNGLAERDDQIARQRERLAELMGGPLSVMQKLAGARRTRLKLVPERPPEAVLQRARNQFSRVYSYDVGEVWEAIWLACPHVKHEGPIPPGFKLLPARPTASAMEQAQLAYRNPSVYDVAHVWHRIWGDSTSASP